MNASVNISVKNLVGPICVSADDGERLHDTIVKRLATTDAVNVSFEGVEMVISAFLNAAIGQLYGELPESSIRERLIVSGMEPEDFELLDRVIDNAKIYFENRKSFDDAWKTEIDDE